MLNTKQLSEYLGCSIITARQLMATRKDMPAIRVGKNWKIEKRMLKSSLKRPWRKEEIYYLALKKKLHYLTD